VAEKTGLGEFRKLLDAGGLPELGPGPRAGVLLYAALSQSLRSLLAGRQLLTDAQALIRALVLLWNDDFDAAHILAQEIDTKDGSFVHGILHRREPDYGNAAYWFRRVGEHDCFPAIAARTAELLDPKGQTALRDGLAPGGEWDPFAFIKLCESAARKSPADLQTQLLQQIQGIETEVLLEYLLDS
jgi:hypothetical protein